MQIKKQHLLKIKRLLLIQFGLWHWHQYLEKHSMFVLRENNEIRSIIMYDDRQKMIEIIYVNDKKISEIQSLIIRHLNRYYASKNL